MRSAHPLLWFMQSPCCSQRYRKSISRCNNETCKISISEWSLQSSVLAESQGPWFEIQIENGNFKPRMTFLVRMCFFVGESLFASDWLIFLVSKKLVWTYFKSGSKIRNWSFGLKFWGRISLRGGLKPWRNEAESGQNSLKSLLRSLCAIFQTCARTK